MPLLEGFKIIRPLRPTTWPAILHYLSKWHYFVGPFVFMSILLICLKAKKIKDKKRPLKYKLLKKPAKLPKRELYMRDGFTLKKVPEELDYIVIGSGIGGLASAAMLSRLGYKVLVLEQHDRAGGCMHVFDDKGFEFDTGVHYIGRMRKYEERINSIIKGKLKWNQLGAKDDHYTYDTILMGDHIKYNYRGLIWKEDLLHRFPNEKEAIEKFANAIKSYTTVPPLLWGLAKMYPIWLGNLLMKFATWYWPELGMNWADVLDSWTSNNELKQVLCGNFGDLGGLSKECSAWIAIGVHKHYLSEGAFYPEGGPEAITKGMIPIIERAGGRVLVRAEVTKIIVSEYNIAMGVMVRKGKNEFAVRAKSGVISAIGYKLTNKLTENKLPTLPKSLQARSVAHITVFLGLRGGQDELKLPSNNFWMFPGMKKDECYDDFIKSTRKEFLQKGRCLGFLGFPSAKDPNFAERFPNKSTAVVISELPWEFVEEWESEKVDHRSDEYKAMKEKWANHVLETCVFKQFPKLRDRVVYKKVGTPLSSAFYLGKEKGESYGLSFPVERYTNSHQYLRPETPIPGLFLTGQDVLTAGWAGALGAAELTVGNILGYFDIPAILSGKTLWGDLVKLPQLREKDFATEY